MYHVYLAGPIKGLAYEDSVFWRDVIKAVLFDTPIKTLSPMRDKEFLTGQVINAAYPESPLGSAEAITARDRYDVMRSDVILVNLWGAKEVSIGTVMEIAWADMLRKPVVLVIDKGNVHNHPMLLECCPFVAEDLDTSVKLVKSILGVQ
jgi:nucleoside 2-deoxyribosyltransferase